MKKNYVQNLVLSLLIAVIAMPSAMAQLQRTPRAASPGAEVTQTVGISTVTINYSRPNVVTQNGNDRTGQIYGKGLPASTGWSDAFPNFGSGNKWPWRAGANENTTITFSDDAKVCETTISAGTYGLFLLLNEDETATYILSKNFSSWGGFFYDESEDVARVDITSVAIPQRNRLTFDFVDITANSATVVLDWEKRRFPLKIEFEVNSIVLASMKNELRSTGGFGWQGWNQAANFSLNNDVELEQGLVWADASINNQKNFNNLNTKSGILNKLERTDEGMVVMNEALELPSANAGNYYGYGRTLIGLDLDDDAMKIFQKLNKKWPDNWLAPHGLARGYSANGDYKQALKYEKIALEKAPDGSKSFLEGYIKTLKEGKDFN